jgi:hypothetical protein
VDESSGEVFLISWLKPTPDRIQRNENVEITVTNGQSKLSIRNKIVIFNANIDPPEFIGSTKYFELPEVRNVSIT